MASLASLMPPCLDQQLPPKGTPEYRQRVNAAEQRCRSSYEERHEMEYAMKIAVHMEPAYEKQGLVAAFHISGLNLDKGGAHPHG